MDSQSDTVLAFTHVHEVNIFKPLEAQVLLNIHICNLLSVYKYYIPHALPFNFTDQILTGFGFSLELHFFKCFASWSSYTVLNLKRKLSKIRLVTITVSRREKSLSDRILTVSDLKDTRFFSEHFLPSKEKGYIYLNKISNSLLTDTRYNFSVIISLYISKTRQGNLKRTWIKHWQN